MTNELLFLFAKWNGENSERTIASLFAGYTILNEEKNNIFICQFYLDHLDDLIEQHKFKIDWNRIKKYTEDEVVGYLNCQRGQVLNILTYDEFNQEIKSKNYNPRRYKSVAVVFRGKNEIPHFENLKEYFFRKDAEEYNIFNHANLIELKFRIGCRQILAALDSLNRSRNKVDIIIDPDGKGCYSEIIYRKIKDCYEYIRTMAFIDEGDGDKINYHFDIGGRLGVIPRKSSEPKKIWFMHYWLGALSYSFDDIYFSYATEDLFLDHITSFKNYMEKKIPFIECKIDRQSINTLSDIELFVEKMIRGRVICLIGEKYLERPYPTFELVSVMKNIGAIDDEGQIIKEKINDIKYRLFPILIGKKAIMTLNEDRRNELEDFWANFDDRGYSKDKIDKIKKLIKPTLEALSRLNMQPLKKDIVTRGEVLKNHRNICNIILFNIITSSGLKIFDHIKKPEHLGD